MTPAPVVAAQLTRRLTALGATSTALGLALALRPATRAFGVQTAGWGVVDLAIARLSGRRTTPPTARRLRTVLLVNAALDVGYVAAGAWLVARPPHRLTPSAARGHGSAVVVQGLALLVLDGVHARALTSAAPAAGAPRR